MSIRDDNINFLSGILSIQNPPEVIDINFTYGLWISTFKHVDLNADGYDFPSWLVEDIIAFEKPITGTCWTEEGNVDGKYAKSRFFITKGIMGTDTYESLEPVAEITDSHVSGTAPLIVMPGVISPGKMYKRCEITGVVKPRFLDTEVLVVSGEDWVFVKPVSGDNLDPNYSYLHIDSGYSGYSNEVITRYKFLYDNPQFSTEKNFISFDTPTQLGDNLDLKYRIAKKSDPFGSFFNVEVSEDGKALIDLKEYRNEKTEQVMSSVVYNFSKIGDDVVSSTVGNRSFQVVNESITGISRSEQNDRHSVQLIATGNYSGIYKLDVLNSHLSNSDLSTPVMITTSGYVMSGYSGSGIGSSTINVASGSSVYFRATSNGIALTNLDLFTEGQLREIIKSEEGLEDPGLGDPDATNIKLINGLIEDEDFSLLSDNNLEAQSIKTFLQNLALPKKIILQDYYSNYLNSGESYIVTPAENYPSLEIDIPCGNEPVSLKKIVAPPDFLLINSTCGGLRIDEVSFCKGDSAIDAEYDPNSPSLAGILVDNGSVTRIPSDGVIKKSNYKGKEPWLDAVNYFYNKNYVSSAVLFQPLTEAGYTNFFKNALSGVKQIIGGPNPENSSENSFLTNGGDAPRIFVEREIYTEPYNENQISEFNRSFNSGSRIGEDSQLGVNSDERLYCVQSYHAGSQLGEDSFFSDDSFSSIKSHNEEINFKKIIENATFVSGNALTSSRLTFKQLDSSNLLFRTEYATGIGSDFTSGNYSGSKVWFGSQNSTITIPNENIKNYAYHLYKHTNAAPTLVFSKSNVKNNDTTPSTSNLDIFVVLKFIKKNFESQPLEYEETDKTISSALFTSAPSDFFRFNIQVYDYSSIECLEYDQWLIFNKNPINDNAYGNQEPAYKAGNINFFEEDFFEALNPRSIPAQFPNGPFISKNHEGTPIDLNSIASLDDGLFKNKIIVIEESKVKLEYNFNSVLDFVEDGVIAKQSVPSDSENFKNALFLNKRRVKITKVRYRFYTKNLIIIGDAGSRESLNFNDGWEYKLQYKITEGQYWKELAASNVFTKDEIACNFGVISSLYSHYDGYNHLLSMVAFEVNLPLYLDDGKYEFKIVKYKKLGNPSSAVDVIKKTNFIPIQVSWPANAACSRFDIYQRDSGNNLKLLGTESLIKTYSYVVPDVRQSYVDLGLANFGASNYSGYYDIIVSGIIPSVSKSSVDLSGIYGFEVGDSNDKLKVNVVNETIGSTKAVAVSDVTYSPMLNFNNPESKNSTFEINQNHNGYYFITDSATSTLNGITGQAFEAYVANTGSSNCSVGGVTLSSGYVAAVSGSLPIVTSGLQVLASGSLSLNNINKYDVIYLKNNFTLLDPGGQEFYLINDSASIITGSYNNTNYSFTGGKTFFMTSTASALTTGLILSNVNIQDDYIYSNTGLTNFDHSKLTLSSAVSSLPVYNVSKNKLTVNNSLLLNADSFNFVTWDGANAPSSVSKNYFDVLRVYLNEADKNDSVTLLQYNTEIIIRKDAVTNFAEKTYYFLKSEPVNRNLNVKIIRKNSSNETISEIKIPSHEQDFKMTVSKDGSFKLLRASWYPSFSVTDDEEQLVILKESLQIDLENLSSSLGANHFIYFINEASQDASFRNGITSDGRIRLIDFPQGEAAKLFKSSDGLTEVKILKEVKNHFQFNIVSGDHLTSPINILNLDFCGTEVNFSNRDDFTNKDTLLICKNRLIPNTVKTLGANIVVDNLQGGVMGKNSIFLNTYVNSNNNLAVNNLSILNPASERVLRGAFSQIDAEDRSPVPSLIPFSEETPDGKVDHYFYINDTGLSNFTLRDFYNRKSKYAGKIFLPKDNQAISIRSFDEKNIITIYNSKSFSFDYSPDGYANGRLEVEEISTDVVLSYESEKGSVLITFDTELAIDDICANFAYDTVTITAFAGGINADTNLGKNRLAVKIAGSLKVFPIYNRSEFFIEGNINYDRYYVISTDVDSIDVDSIIIPDTYGAYGLIINNTSSRSYPIKTLSGSAITVILPNQQIKLLYNSPWGFAGHTDTGYTEDGFEIVWIVIKFSNQWVETSSTHPLEFICPRTPALDADANRFLNNFINTSHLLYLDYEIVDFGQLPTGSTKKIYCYGRSLKRELTEEQKNNHVTLVNAFYLRLESGTGIIEKNEFTSGDGDRFPLAVIERKHVDLLSSFDNVFLQSSRGVIFIPITSHLVTYYLPNLSQSLAGGVNSLGSIITGKTIVFINLIQSSATAPNQVVNYSDTSTENLLDINSLLVYQASTTTWTKQSSGSNPLFKTVYPTLKNVKGLTETSDAATSDGSELVYLSNFDKFYVNSTSFKNQQYGDFYVYNSCAGSVSVKAATDTKFNEFQAFKFSKIHREAVNFFKSTLIPVAAPSSFYSVLGEIDKDLKLKSGSIAKVTTSKGMTVYRYDDKEAAIEITDLNKKCVLNLANLKKYDENDKLFIFKFGFCDLELLNVNDTSLGSEKFYVHNANTSFLKIFIDTLTFTLPAARTLEISKDGISYMQTHSKGMFYTSSKVANKNYLSKSKINIFADALIDYQFVDTQTYFEKIKTGSPNVAISLLQDSGGSPDIYVYSFAYVSDYLYVSLGTLSNYYDDKKITYFISNNEQLVSQKIDVFNIKKPSISVSTAGHYIVNDNNNDISVTVGSNIFLVNNSVKDISVKLSSGTNLSPTLFRNTVLVINSSGGIRYLKKAKRRDEFYCVFNLKTMISFEYKQFPKAAREGLRGRDILPVSDPQRYLRASYVKLLSKSGATSSTHLSLRDYYNGVDIPTDSPENILAYEVGIGHETIYKFLFFDPSESTYTLPGIEDQLLYVVDVDLNFFYNLKELQGAYSDKIDEDPYVKYDGKKYRHGETFTGGPVSNYEIKYPNYVKVAKLVQDLGTPTPFENYEPDPVEQIDSSLIEEVEIDARLEFQEKIITDLKVSLDGEARCWIPKEENAFWQDPDSAKEYWTITYVDASDTKTIKLEDQTVSFVKCALEKPDVTEIKEYITFYSALQFKYPVATPDDLLIGIDFQELGKEETAKLKLANRQGYEMNLDFIVPPDDVFKPGELREIPFLEIEKINNISVTLSKLTTMPTVEFENFSESAIMQLLNK